MFFEQKESLNVHVRCTLLVVTFSPYVFTSKYKTVNPREEARVTNFKNLIRHSLRKELD